MSTAAATGKDHGASSASRRCTPPDKADDFDGDKIEHLRNARQPARALLVEYFLRLWWVDYLATGIILAFVAREAVESYHELHEQE